MCRSNYSRAEVSFFCRLYTSATFRRGKRLEERNTPEQKGRPGGGEEKRGITFPPPWKTRGKGSYLGLLVYFFPSLRSFSPVSLCLWHTSRLFAKGLHFWLRDSAICVSSSLFGFMTLVPPCGSSLFHANFSSHSRFAKISNAVYSSCLIFLAIRSWLRIASSSRGNNPVFLSDYSDWKLFR